MENNTSRKQTIAINGRSFSIELVAKALGIYDPITSFQVRQPIMDGYLRADLVSPKLSSPGIDLVLEKDDMRLALARVEQDDLTTEDPVMAALYARNGHIMAFMAADTRTDDTVADEGAMDYLIAANFCEVSRMSEYFGTVPEPKAFIPALDDPEPVEALQDGTDGAGEFAIIKETVHRGRSGSLLSVVATVPSMMAAHDFCRAACEAECHKLQEGKRAAPVSEWYVEPGQPNGFFWEPFGEEEPENADDRFQYVVHWRAGECAHIISGFSIRAIGEETDSIDSQRTELVSTSSQFEAGQFLRLNSHQYSLRQIADLLGLEEELKTIRLCQQLPSGVLSAELDPYQLDYPGIDVLMEVASSDHDGPDEFFVARCEQDAENEGPQPVKAYLYARCGDYIANKELDIRNHADFENGEKKPESLVVGGGYAIGPLDVYYEDARFFNLMGQYPCPMNS